MPTPRFLATIVAVAIPLVAATAHADDALRPGAPARRLPLRASPAPTVFDRTHMALEGSAGLATPLGSVGLTLILSPVAPLSIEAGVGSSSSGAQTSAMLRLLMSEPGRVGLSLAAGASTGPYESRPLLFGPTEVWENAVWVNAEMSVDARLDSNVMLRVFAGLGHVVASDECYTLDTDSAPGTRRRPGTCPRDADPPTLPFIGVAFRIGV
jgi:hypothetical protein